MRFCQKQHLQMDLIVAYDRTEPLRNHVRFSSMSDEHDWRAPHTSPSPRSSSPMPLDLDPSSSSGDLIANANPNLNGVDPARARWAQKGAGAPASSTIVSTNMLSSFISHGVEHACAAMRLGYSCSHQVMLPAQDSCSDRSLGILWTLFAAHAAAVMMTHCVALQTDGAQATSLPVLAAECADSLASLAKVMDLKACETFRSTCLTLMIWMLTILMSLTYSRAEHKCHQSSVKS